jgi:hypothetical protein
MYLQPREREIRRESQKNCATNFSGRGRSLTIKISRVEVFEHVQKPPALRLKIAGGRTQVLHSRATVALTRRGWSCMLVDDGGTLQSYDWARQQSCDLTRGAATSSDFLRPFLGVYMYWWVDSGVI